MFNSWLSENIQESKIRTQQEQRENNALKKLNPVVGRPEHIGSSTNHLATFGVSDFQDTEKFCFGDFSTKIWSESQAEGVWTPPQNMIWGCSDRPVAVGWPTDYLGTFGGPIWMILERSILGCFCLDFWSTFRLPWGGMEPLPRVWGPLGQCLISKHESVSRSYDRCEISADMAQ